jgi:FAD synthase
MEKTDDSFLLVKRGVVMRGKQLGKGLGFPTANIALDSADASGTYAGVVVIAGTEWPAAVYADQEKNLLEAHILGFDGDLYGQEIEVRLLEKLAEPRRFDNPEELRVFVADMVGAVRKYFQK